MAMTLSTAWTIAIRSAARSEYRWLIDIYDGTTHWKAVDDICDQFQYHSAVKSIVFESAELSPKTNIVQSMGVDVLVNDNWIRPILSANRLKGMQITVSLGTHDMAEGTFEAMFTGVVDNDKPEPNGGPVLLECLGIMSIMLEQKIVGAWVNEHPLDVMLDIIDNQIGLAAAFRDATSMDPDDAGNAASSHLVVTRATPPALAAQFPDAAINQPVPAQAAFSQLLQIVDGVLFEDEAGKQTVKVFDSTEAVVDNWAQDDIIELEQLDNWGDMANQITVAAGGGTAAARTMLPGWEGQTLSSSDLPYGSDVGDFYYQVGDTVSQGNHGFGFVSSRIVNEMISNPWIVSGMAYVSETIAVGATSLIIRGGVGFAGLREIYSGSQPAGAKIDAGNPAYLLLRQGAVGPLASLAPMEIVKCTSAHVAGNKGTWSYLDPASATATATGSTSINTPQTFTATIARAQLGTVARGFYRGAYVLDITAAVYIAANRLARFTDAAPKIRVKTGYKQIKAQYGDLVTVTWPSFLAYGADGIDDTTKWQVIKKEVVPHAGSTEPGVEWILQRATIGTPTKAHSVWSNDLKNSSEKARNKAFDGEVSRWRINQGMGVALDSNFNVTVESGTAESTYGVHVQPEDVTITVNALKDTYVYHDTVLGKVVQIEVANNAARPTTPLGCIPRGKVVSGAGSATSVVDLRDESRGSVGSLGLVTDSLRAYGGIVPNGDLGEWD